MPTDTLVWTQDQTDKTPRDVIAEFARCFWDTPRQAMMVDRERFRMADGVATYRVELKNRIYAIYREAV